MNAAADKCRTEVMKNKPLNFGKLQNCTTPMPK